MDCNVAMAEKRRLLIVEEEEAGCAGFCSRVSCSLCAGACRSVYFVFRKMFGCLRVFVDQTDDTEKWLRHSTGWSNMFAFPWEVSAYWNFTTR